MSRDIEFGMQMNGFGDPVATLEDALLYEKTGFDHISMPDHLFHPFDERFISKPAWDAYVLLSALAVQTESAKLATGVSDPLRRHPATIAHMVATLDIISNGRARLGIGAGERFTFHPLLDIKFEKPATFLRESLMVIKGLWRATKDNPLNFEGKFLRVKGGFLGLYPKQKYPPILIGGYGPRLRKIVAELGDYWVPWVDSLEKYEKNFKEIKKWSKELGREKEVKGAIITYSCIAESKDEALKALAEIVKLAVAMRTRLLKDLGYKEYAEEILPIWNNPFDRHTVTKLYEVADSLPDEVVEKAGVIGTRDDVIERIEEFSKAGVNLFITEVPPGIEKTLGEYKEVIQYFKEQER